MSEKVLYFLGAGASCQALPMVKDSPDGSQKGLSKSMIALADFMKTQQFETKEQQFVNDFIEHLHKLAVESDDFTTIDTYAKHLYLVDRLELEKLKITLSLYFTIEQLYFQKIDKRYMVFLTTILEHKNVFPPNVKVLTWNYDFQMELVGYRYNPESVQIGDSRNSTSVRRGSLLDYYPQAGNVFSDFAQNANPAAYQIIHLNGIAGIYNFRDSRYYCDNVFLRVKSKAEGTLQNLIQHFLDDGENKLHLLTFAWEKADTDSSSYLDRRMFFVEGAIKDSTILVIIGYSFPYFNREIDRRIFDKLKEDGTVKKIYFQNPYLDGSFLREQFDLGDIVIEHISRSDSFFVPLEL